MDYRFLETERLQEAVDLAAGLGCTCVALGGYTSIIARDGEAVLPPPGVRVTSGNTFTVVVAHNGEPSLTATQSFEVTVAEFVALGTLVVQAGQDGCLPVTLDSTEPITNVHFTVRCPPGTFTNLSIYPLLPDLCASNLQALSATQWVVNLSVCYQAFNHIERFNNFDRYDPNTSAGKNSTAY